MRFGKPISVELNGFAEEMEFGLEKTKNWDKLNTLTIKFLLIWAKA